jgi:hypothetical protein
MNRILLVCGLVASGCVVNHAELDAQQAVVDRHLAEAMVKANDFIELRRGAEAIAERARDGVREFPELGDEWESVQATPDQPLLARPPLVLPPKSLFEGSEGARKRDKLIDSDARLRAHDKIVSEVAYMERRNQRAARLLESIEKARAARAK